MKIKITKKIKNYNVGDIIDVDDKKAIKLIQESKAKFATIKDITRHSLVKPKTFLKKIIRK